MHNLFAQPRSRNRHSAELSPVLTGGTFCCGTGSLARWREALRKEREPRCQTTGLRVEAPTRRWGRGRRRARYGPPFFRSGVSIVGSPSTAPPLPARLFLDVAVTACQRRSDDQAQQDRPSSSPEALVCFHPIRSIAISLARISSPAVCAPAPARSDSNRSTRASARARRTASCFPDLATFWISPNTAPGMIIAWLPIFLPRQA